MNVNIKLVLTKEQMHIRIMYMILQLSDKYTLNYFTLTDALIMLR